MTEDEMVGWDHQLNGHEFEQVPGAGDGWEGLVCCSQRGCKELDVTEHTSTIIHRNRISSVQSLIRV